MSIQNSFQLPDDADGGRNNTKPFAPAPETDLMAALLDLGRMVHGELALEEVFAQIAHVARDAIPGADEVSVTMVRGDHANTAASTGQLASALDERQYAHGFGPCLDSARTGKVFLVTDMTTETRWSDYTAEAVQGGALSSLSMPLPLRSETVGALNIYARTRDAFDDYGQQMAAHVAAYAAVAMTNAGLYLTTARLAEQMRQAMESRAVIEQAKGIIMGERRCSADDAFDLLAKVSQDANRKLRDVAGALVQQAKESGAS